MMISSILVISQDEFQGANLTNFIQNELDYYCERCDFQENFGPCKDDTQDKALYLWDYLGNKADYFWWVKKVVNAGGSEASFFTIYNVPKELKIEDQLLEAGVHGIFYEGQDLTVLTKGINTILGGELWYPRKVMTEFINNKFKKNDRPSRRSTADVLTSREEEILALIAAGKMNVEIAENLFISQSTVKTHVYNIFQKIHVQNRVQAALWAANKKKRYP